MPLNQIDQIAELAAQLTPVTDIAALIGVGEDILRAELSVSNSPVRLAYLRARAQTALELRKQEIELAKAGSPMAVHTVSGYIRDMQDDDDL